MNKTELESKHLAELHTLAEEAGVERYRMLSRAELIEKLAGGEAKGGSKPSSARGGSSQRRRQRDGDRSRSGERRPREPRRQRDSAGGERKEQGRGRKDRQEEKAEQPKPKPQIAPATTPPPGRPKRKRRRRWGRRRKGMQVHDLLLPVSSGRQVLIYGETREGCTALLRSLAADLSEGKGPDPIALLVDPTPEELADWKRDAPKAEIVVAGQGHHAEDAAAQAVRRAEGGDEVILLVDSLSRFDEAFGDADLAKEIFGAGIGLGGSGALTVVAALERPQ